jgi:hypothetical protein
MLRAESTLHPAGAALVSDRLLSRRLRCGFGASICGRRPGRLGRRFPSDANDLQSVPRAAGQSSQRRHISEPGLAGRRLTIRQRSDAPAPFWVADDAVVSMMAPPSPIITVNGSTSGGRRRTARTSVFLLTRSISRLMKPVADRPPSARRGFGAVRSMTAYMRSMFQHLGSSDSSSCRLSRNEAVMARQI